jgi:hypothetical protein
MYKQGWNIEMEAQETMWLWDSKLKEFSHWLKLGTRKDQDLRLMTTDVQKCDPSLDSPQIFPSPDIPNFVTRSSAILQLWDA